MNENIIELHPTNQKQFNNEIDICLLKHNSRWYKMNRHEKLTVMKMNALIFANYVNNKLCID